MVSYIKPIPYRAGVARQELENTYKAWWWSTHQRPADWEAVREIVESTVTFYENATVVGVHQCLDRTGNVRNRVRLRYLRRTVTVEAGWELEGLLSHFESLGVNPPVIADFARCLYTLISNERVARMNSEVVAATRKAQVRDAEKIANQRLAMRRRQLMHEIAQTERSLGPFVTSGELTRSRFDEIWDTMVVQEVMRS